MNRWGRLGMLSIAFTAVCLFAQPAEAALTLTSGNNATTTPNVATSITGFQIVGAAASSTPVKLFATSGTLALGSTSGLTFDGASSGSTIYFSGTVANINAALSTLTYSRASTGTDTLEVSLVNRGEIFFTDNNHLYQFVSGSYTWNAAKTAAEARTSYGASGYLATITSSAENTFVSGRLTGDGWIGGTDSAVEGTWKWATGPEAGTTFWQGTGGGSTVGGNYAQWNTGEPNQSGEEDCAETYVASGKWNDLPCSATLGYVVEYGAPGDLPTVVATNISVVTADVPAVTSLSPLNGASSIGVNANLVIGFSKAVSAGTGNVTIYKVSDDSVVEAIDVSSEKVTGGGTTSITLNPDATLDEGTEYYILIPSTAFKDASENIFDGISDESTWAFTTEDVTAPVLSAVTITDLATTTATVTWTSGEAGSSKVVYSTGSSYASTTSETNTSSRVTSHSKGLTGLTRCTTYNYKAVSGDSFANYATSTSALFTTLGCVGNSAPAAATTTTVTVSGTATSTLTQSGRTLTVSTPENFTATSSTVVIQIRSQEATGVLDAVGMPGSLSTAASIVFDVTAIVDDEVELDSFDAPVTITYEYTDTDIDGIDESTLSMYHYHDDAWFELDDCSLDMAGNSITCTTPNFSIFGIFGSPPVTAGGSSSIKRGTSIQGQVRNLISLGKVAEAAVLKAAWPHLFAESAVAATSVPVSTNITMVRDLEYLMTGDDVRQLQVLLNANKYALTSSGVGSGGNETDYFGTLTRTALSRYQTANGITPAVGYFGPLTRAQMKSVGIGWW